MDKEEFLIQHLTEDKNYDEISKLNNISPKQLSDWWEEGKELRSQIKRSNQTFNNKKENSDFDYFKSKGKRYFFEWYNRQPRVCIYCGIEEYKLQKVFDKDFGNLRTKRGRGSSLELERRDTSSNLYNEENCALACYLCNNHKSDLITEDEHRRFFATKIKEYLDLKYEELMELDKTSKTSGTIALDFAAERFIGDNFGEDILEDLKKSNNNDNR